MKNLLLVLLLVSFLASCGSESGKRSIKSRNVPFRAKSTWVSTVSFNRYVSNNVEIVYADSAFRVGDTVTIDATDYILEERVY